MEIYPLVGARHQEVERIVAVLRGQPNHSYIPPTVGRPLAELMPAHRYRTWTFDGGAQDVATAIDMTQAVAAFGIPFMAAATSFDKLCALIEEGRLGIPEQLVYPSGTLQVPIRSPTGPF